MLLKPNQLIIATLDNLSIESDYEIDTLIQNSYEQDSITKELIMHFKNPKLEKSHYIKRKLNNFSFKNNFILFQNLIYIPDIIELKLKLLQMYHDSPTAGHFGRSKTLELISRNYFWPKMRNFINNYISSCEQCSRCKVLRHKPYGYLQPLPIPTKPWQAISIDFIVKLPISNNYIAILVIVDRFTKMAYFIPTVNEIDAKNTAKLFLNNIYKLYSLPQEIVLDCGTIFISKFWLSLMDLLKVKRNLSSAFYPQSDG